jgi:hypothetical protein
MDFNHLFILECFLEKHDRKLLDMFTIPSMKDFNISTAYQWLKKNEYLVEDPNDSSKLIISVKGEDLMEQMYLIEDPVKTGDVSTSVIIVNHSKTPDECFEEWWKAYPSSTSWKSDDGNTIFSGSRTLKNLRKPAAKGRYLKLLNQGYKHEDLLGSLLYEIKLKKLDSIKKNTNQMDYFKGLEAYLNQECYLSFIDEYKANPTFVKTEQIKGKKANVTDI